MGLPSAWAIHNGDPGVKIGVFDFGVVRDQLDMNDGIISGDGGYQGPHGTQVASIIYGDVNDEDGPMAGINWHATRAAYFYSQGYNALNAETLVRAWTDGCQFINCSFRLVFNNRDRVYSSVFHQAASAVRMAGGIIITASGNTGREGNLVESPANFPEAITVAAINRYAERADFSTRGDWVDFAAPGDSVWIAHWPSSIPDSLIDSTIIILPPMGEGEATLRDSIASGTSYAAPQITGIASLLYSYALTRGYTLNDFDDIYNLLRFSADPLTYPSGWNEQTGWGMPMLDSAYWLVTKPNTIERFVVDGGWDETQTSDMVELNGFSTLYFDPYYPWLSYEYPVIRHDLEQWVTYEPEFHKVYGAWIRGRTSEGAGIEEPIDSHTRAGRVLAWNDDSCLIATSWYEIFRPDYPTIRLAIHPCQTTGIHLDVAVVGEVKLVPQNIWVNLSDPSKTKISWNDPNEIEQYQRLYRQVNGSTTWFSEGVGPGFHEFPDTIASTPYKYWMAVGNTHQTAYSDTLTVRHRPRQPENCEATVKYIDPTDLSKDALGKATTEDLNQPVLSNLVSFDWDQSASQPSGTVDNWIIEQRDIHCYWVPIPTGGNLWVCDTVWEVIHEIPAEETSATLCFERSEDYVMRIRTVDVYGDTNVYCNDCNTLQFTTGSYWGCSIHIPVCDKPAVPDMYMLSQNRPNPFNASTIIEFGLPVEGNVRLEIYDVLGRRVRRLIDDLMPAGYHIVTWNGRDDRGVTLASGMYFYRLTAEAYTETKKMILMK